MGATFWFYQHQMFNLKTDQFGDADTAASLSGWGERWPKFLEKKYKEKELNESTTWKQVEKMWAMHQDFEKKGEQSFNSKNYPQATYWYFQYQTHKIGDELCPKYNFIDKYSIDKWKGFPEFLKKKTNDGTINVLTTWEQVEEMWIQKKKVA